MDSIIFGLDEIISEIIDLLPDSPFAGYLNQAIDGVVGEVLGWVNVFIPFGEMLAVGAMWLTAIGGYLLYSVALRMIKAVQ